MAGKISKKMNNDPAGRNNVGDADYSGLEKRLLNEFQRDFPLSTMPYADLADALGTDQESVIDLLKKLQSSGTISRVGAIFKPNTVGTSVLAALAVPENRVTEIAAMINSYSEVNHNYEREHEFNLWFVVTAADEKQLNIVLDEIEGRSRMPMLRLPILDEYHIDLGFELQWN